MNVFIDDPDDRLRPEQAHSLALRTGGMVCIVRAAMAFDGGACRTLQFFPDDRTLRTRCEVYSFACCTLLVGDVFPVDEPFAILPPDETCWDQILLSFSRDCDPFPIIVLAGVEPPMDLDTLHQTLAGRGGKAAWFRTAGAYFEMAREAVRREVRVQGEYSVAAIMERGSW